MVEVAPTLDPELGGFTYVKRKGRRKTPLPKNKIGNGKKHTSTATSTSRHNAASETSIVELKDKYRARQDMLQSSAFLRDFKESFQTLLDDSSISAPAQIQMMGIGTLTHNPSLTQLAFGMQLIDLLGLKHGTCRTSDPMYTALDKELLASLELQIESVEDGNKHDTAQKTLIFAPHVPKSVYESILRQYWHNMDNLIIIGNDLRHYPDIYADKQLRSESPAILALAQGTQLQVVPLPSNFEHNNVFNDLAVMWIPKDTSLPEIDFKQSVIEKEKFEVNQDDVASLGTALDALKVTDNHQTKG